MPNVCFEGHAAHECLRPCVVLRGGSSATFYVDVYLGLLACFVESLTLTSDVISIVMLHVGKVS